MNARFHAMLGQVELNVNETGLPGAALFKNLLNWLGQLALWGSLASILIGAAIWGLSHNSGYGNGTQNGRRMLFGGVIGALLVGLGPTIVNELFDSAQV